MLFYILFVRCFIGVRVASELTGVCRGYGAVAESGKQLIYFVRKFGGVCERRKLRINMGKKQGYCDEMGSSCPLVE